MIFKEKGIDLCKKRGKAPKKKEGRGEEANMWKKEEKREGGGDKNKVFSS